MTQNGDGGRVGVLSELDRRDVTGLYWSLALLATLGGFLFGYDTANIGSALSFVPYHLGGFALGYLVSGASIGAAVGALLAGPLADRFGRKSLLVADALIYAVGAILSAVTWHQAVLLSARTLIGLAIGADSAIATAYIAEFAPAKRRGSLSMLQQWMITVGILVAYVIALIILKAMPTNAYTVDWRLILGLGAVPALIALALRARMPESPRWLLHHERYDAARVALGKLGLTATAEQLHHSAAAVREAERAAHRGLSPGVRRALVVVVVFLVFQQITGINIPLYYGPHLLGPMFGAGRTTVTTATAGVAVTAIMTAVNVAATYFAFRWIDRVGRRKLAIGGYTGMAVCMVFGAAVLAATSGVTEIVLVMIALDLFIASFAIGVGGTGWLIQAEVFPTYVRGRAASLGATADWLANFAVIEVFPAWQAGIGLPWVMVCFAGLAVLAAVFVFVFLPETKQMTVEEITETFERTAAAGTLASARG